MYQAKSIVYNAVFVCMVLTVASVAYAIEDPPVFDRQWSTPFPWELHRIHSETYTWLTATLCK